MKIRKSRIDDVATLLSIRDSAREIMRASGNMKQWPDGVPGEALFRADIEAGDSYIIMDDDDHPVGTFALIGRPDPDYATVTEGDGWRQINAHHAIIHRLASNGECHGIFKAVLDFARQTYDDIRIDTHEENAIMLSALPKYGFRRVGIVNLRGNLRRVAFQWRADQ